VIDQFNADYLTWQGQTAGGPATPSTLSAAERQAIALVTSAQMTLNMRLSPAGLSRLNQFVQAEKQHMIVKP
jgi:hypothetical protein